MKAITDRRSKLQNDNGFTHTELLCYHKVIKNASSEKQTEPSGITNNEQSLTEPEVRKAGNDKTSKRDKNNNETSKKGSASPRKRVDKRKRETLDEPISNTNRRGNPVTGKIGVPDSLEIAWRNTYSSTAEQHPEADTKVLVYWIFT